MKQHFDIDFAAFSGLTRNLPLIDDLQWAFQKRLAEEHAIRNKDTEDAKNLPAVGRGRGSMRKKDKLNEDSDEKEETKETSKTHQYSFINYKHLNRKGTLGLELAMNELT